ncbi:MAG: ABC transporter substrate-binding protein [Candidatus Polarisedimenticolaceae bacterium]|nr:ABC transporter substrate-binding protein [Candidatus Polarisedimenticolaceae bacterium]
MRIGTNVWIGYEPLYLARDLGYYTNTQVKLVELTSASEVIHALRNGMLEGAALTLDEALTMLDDGFDLHVVLVMDFSHGADALMVKPEITSLAELRGKRIAVEQSSVGAILLDGVLNAAKLDPTEVEIIPCVADEHPECYSSVDAVVTFEPFKTKLLQQGARLLFDSRQIPNRIVDILVVPRATIKRHPQSLKQLLDGYFKARKYLSTQPDDAASRMEARLGLTAVEILDAYKELSLPGLEENITLLDRDEGQLEGMAQELADFMLQRKLLKNKLHIRDLLDHRFLPKSAP